MVQSESVLMSLVLGQVPVLVFGKVPVLEQPWVEQRQRPRLSSWLP